MILRGALDEHRRTLRRQAEGLTPEQLAQRLAPSTMTLAGMLRHLACVEHWWCWQVLVGEEAQEPWSSVDWDADGDWDWHSAQGMSFDELDAELVAAIERSDRCIDAVLAADPDLGQLARGTAGRGEAPSVRWILVHLVEEYARHCGHADLLREAIDEATDR